MPLVRVLVNPYLTREIGILKNRLYNERTMGIEDTNLPEVATNKSEDGNLTPRQRAVMFVSYREAQERKKIAERKEKEAVIVAGALEATQKEFNEAMGIEEEIEAHDLSDVPDLEHDKTAEVGKVGPDDMPTIEQEGVPKTEEGRTLVGGESGRKPKDMADHARELLGRNSEDIEKDIEALNKKINSILGPVNKVVGAALSEVGATEMRGVRVWQWEKKVLEEDLKIARQRERFARLREEQKESNRSQAQRQLVRNRRRELSEARKARKKIMEDREKSPFKYKLIDGMHPINFFVVFQNLKDDTSVEELDEVLGADGKQFKIIDLPEVDPDRLNAIALSTNGFYLRLTNIKEIVKGEEKLVDKRDPRARYDLFYPNGEKYNFKGRTPDFLLAYREFTTTSEEYFKTELDSYNQGK
jgi:hypothetical protein